MVVDSRATKYGFQQPTSQDLKNVVADKKIQFEQSSKWKLRESVSKTIVSTFGKPDIDLFGSRINQLSNYISWRTDRGPRLLMHFP